MVIAIGTPVSRGLKKLKNFEGDVLVLVCVTVRDKL